MDRVTIDTILLKISAQLRLSKETETELLEEIRSHLEEAIAEAAAKGENEQLALVKAAEQFGIEELGEELQEVHAGQESIDAIVASALPVLFALILRWLVFAPEGSTQAWPPLLVPLGFWMLAIAALLVPFLLFRRWRMALVGWGFFWLITVLFAVFPSTNNW
jgi:hypothetical protein